MSKDDSATTSDLAGPGRDGLRFLDDLRPVLDLQLVRHIEIVADGFLEGKYVRLIKL